MHTPLSQRITARRLLIAVGVSLALHVIVLSNHGSLSPPGLAASAGRLELRLGTAPQPAASALSEPPATSSADELPSTPAMAVPAKPDKPIVMPDPADKPLPRTPPVKSAASPAVNPAPSSAAPVATPAVAPVTPSAPAAASGSTDQATGIPSPGLSGPVKRAIVEFAIVSGPDRRALGTERHYYVADSGGNYGLSVKQMLGADGQAQAKPWQIDISGVITRQGLSPNVFNTVGALPERIMAEKTPADNSTLHPAQPRRGRVPDGLLDRQSLLFQFMIRPPEVVGGELWLTDGVVHRVYGYRMAGIESLSLPGVGVVKTIRLLISAEGSAGPIELWLVPDMHYLPVKVRDIDYQGGVIERTATALDFDN